MRNKQVVVIGESDTKEYLDEAYEIGKFIATNGHILISGGGGGIMEAASKGASENNGTVIGIIPEAVCMKQINIVILLYQLVLAMQEMSSTFYQLI